MKRILLTVMVMVAGLSILAHDLYAQNDKSNVRASKMQEKMDAWHAANPDKCYGISEYGADNYTCWHSAAPFNHDYTEEYAVLYHHEMLKTFAQRPYLWATHVWNMFDFAVDSRDEGGFKGLNAKGLVTFDRKIRKDSFYLYKAYWTTDPMVHICGRRFYDRAPGERTVEVLTNEQEVTLLLNGKEFATLPAVDHKVVFSDLPLLDGENTLVAKTANAEDTITLNGVAEHNIGYDVPDIMAAVNLLTLLKIWQENVQRNSSVQNSPMFSHTQALRQILQYSLQQWSPETHTLV